MQRPPIITETLNELLASEFAALHQYLAHQQWSVVGEYVKLAGIFGEHVDDEKAHATKLIHRIYQIGATPNVETMTTIIVGATPTDMLTADLAAEETAIRRYNDGIKTCVDVGDNATRDLLAAILADEEHHASEFTSLLNQIQDMTLANWLSAMV